MPSKGDLYRRNHPLRRWIRHQERCAIYIEDSVTCDLSMKVVRERTGRPCTCGLEQELEQLALSEVLVNSPIWHKKEELAKSGTSFNIGDYHEFANCGVTGFWYWTEGVDKSAASGSRYYGPYRNKKDAAKARNDFFAIKRFGE